MELYIYNSSVYLYGITDCITSIKWTKRFFSGDSFEILLPVTEKNLSLIQKQRIVEIPKKYVGYITALKIFTDNSGIEQIKISGTSLDGMLKRRVLAYGSASDTFMGIIDLNAGAEANIYRRFPKTSIDKTVDCPSLFNDTLKYKQLDRYIKFVGQRQNFGVKAEIVHGSSPFTNSIRFYGKRGVDRSVAQTENVPVIFSDAYDNIDSCGYNYNETEMRNSVVCYAHGKHDEVRYIDIDEYTGISVPLNDERGYEVFETAVEVEAKIKYKPRSNGVDIVMWQILDPTTTSILSDNVNANCLSNPIDNMNSSLIISSDYEKSFDVGDIVTISNKRLKLTEHKRIIEITELYDAYSKSISVVL